MDVVLNEVREYLSRIPYINEGGCGIAAISMYRWLLENEEDSKLICFYNEFENYELNKNNIIYNFPYLLSPNHCGIIYQNRILDSEEEINKNYYPYHQNLNEIELLKMINLSSWNPNFERKNINKIEKGLQINLSDIYRI